MGSLFSSLGRNKGKLTLALILPFGLIALALWYFFMRKPKAQSVDTGSGEASTLPLELAIAVDADRFPKLTRFAPMLARHIPDYFNPESQVEAGKILTAIFMKESSGNPPPVIGDTQFPNGPSVGPGQVYRRTAKALGFWDGTAAPGDKADQDAYKLIALDEDKCVEMACAVLADILNTSGKDDWYESVRLYNGPAAPRSYPDTVFSNKGKLYG